MSPRPRSRSTHAEFGSFSLSGIALTALAATVLYQLLREPRTPETEEDRMQQQAAAPADAAVEAAGPEPLDEDALPQPEGTS